MIIKTCGLREPENITAIAELEVNWLGLIFYPKSPRYVGDRPDLVAWLNDPGNGLDERSRVGVFVNAEFTEILDTVRNYRLDYVQLHGGESAVYCSTLKQLLSENSDRSVGIIRAFRVSRAFDFGVTVDYEAYCTYFLFDTKGAFYGGTGHKFDWSILDRYEGKTPFLLSGGIGPEDAAAIRAVNHPKLKGVDLNSKFEEVPGRKDVALLTKFVNTLRSSR